MDGLDTVSVQAAPQLSLVGIAHVYAMRTAIDVYPLSSLVLSSKLTHACVHAGAGKRNKLCFLRNKPVRTPYPVCLFGSWFCGWGFAAGGVRWSGPWPC